MGRPKGARTHSGRAPLLFKQTEVVRAVKGVKQGGLEVSGVKVTRTGDIVIETGKSLKSNAGNGELEDWMAKNADQIEGH
jgi:hypothetical protein